ncbi:hypothetical protein H0H92_008461 [Tricholoma furcatifolium]|nr:hypothetical protein H0H92_008461 [Tricholoma furcatifolium]
MSKLIRALCGRPAKWLDEEVVVRDRVQQTEKEDIDCKAKDSDLNSRNLVDKSGTDKDGDDKIRGSRQDDLEKKGSVDSNSHDLNPGLALPQDRDAVSSSVDKADNSPILVRPSEHYNRKVEGTVRPPASRQHHSRDVATTQSTPSSSAHEYSDIDNDINDFNDFRLPYLAKTYYRPPSTRKVDENRINGAWRAPDEYHKMVFENSMFDVETEPISAYNLHVKTYTHFQMMLADHFRRWTQSNIPQDSPNMAQLVRLQEWRKRIKKDVHSKIAHSHLWAVLNHLRKIIINFDSLLLFNKSQAVNQEVASNVELDTGGLLEDMRSTAQERPGTSTLFPNSTTPPPSQNMNPMIIEYDSRAELIELLCSSPDRELAAKWAESQQRSKRHAEEVKNMQQPQSEEEHADYTVTVKGGDSYYRTMINPGDRDGDGDGDGKILLGDFRQENVKFTQKSSRRDNSISCIFLDADHQSSPAPRLANRCHSVCSQKSENHDHTDEGLRKVHPPPAVRRQHVYSRNVEQTHSRPGPPSYLESNNGSLNTSDFRNHYSSHTADVPQTQSTSDNDLLSVRASNGYYKIMFEVKTYDLDETTVAEFELILAEWYWDQAKARHIRYDVPSAEQILR